MLILTSTFLKYVKKGFKFGQTLHGHPFVWDDTKDEPELCGWRNGLGIWYLNLILTLLYTGFLVQRVIQVHTEVDEEGNLKWSLISQVYTLFIAVYYSLTLLLQVSLFVKKNKFCGYFRQTIKSVGILQG